MIRRPVAVVAVVALIQLLLVGVAVGPQLAAYAVGEEYRLRVQPIDPIDFLRGAYVELDYPDLAPPEDRFAVGTPVYVSLVADGPDSGLSSAGSFSVNRPEEGPYLACTSEGWRLTCGIESYFADQIQAQRLERELVDGGVATVRVDGRGHAVVVSVD